MRMKIVILIDSYLVDSWRKGTQLRQTCTEHCRLKLNSRLNIVTRQRNVGEVILFLISKSFLTYITLQLTCFGSVFLFVFP